MPVIHSGTGSYADQRSGSPTAASPASQVRTSWAPLPAASRVHLHRR